MAIKFKLKDRIADVEFRERRVVQLKEIAEATGIHRVTLSKLANNKRYNVGIDTIDKLCAYFGCGVGDLVEFVADADVPPRPGA
jgi:putative transcriptional regulator